MNPTGFHCPSAVLERGPLDPPSGLLQSVESPGAPETVDRPPPPEDCFW